MSFELQIVDPRRKLDVAAVGKHPMVQMVVAANANMIESASETFSTSIPEKQAAHSTTGIMCSNGKYQLWHKGSSSLR